MSSNAELKSFCLSSLKINKAIKLLHIHIISISDCLLLKNSSDLYALHFRGEECLGEFQFPTFQEVAFGAAGNT